MRVKSEYAESDSKIKGPPMKHFLIFLLSSLIFLSGCESKAGTGAAAGAGLGAVSGALIGGNAEGALIGGAIGAIGGAIIGSALDEQDRKIMEQNHPQTLKKIDRNEQLSTDDIKEMTKAGLNENVIISQIQGTGSIFYLSTDEIIDLKNQGVSQKVIDYMIQTGKG